MTCLDATPIVLAADGGGSKTDVLAIDLDGAVIAHERGRGGNPQVVGWAAVRAELDRLRTAVLTAAGERRLLLQHVYMAGLDLPEELESAATQLGHWTAFAPLLAENDLFALLRAGTAAKDAVAVVCGTGINAIGVRADGATARFPALGEVSGDWGGGAGLGSLAMWHAIRAEDGRGPETSLRSVVAGAFGAGSVREVVEALHLGRLPATSLTDLTPLLFAAAEAGDAVAAAVVDRQAEEIVLMAQVLLCRLDLQQAEVPVVLGGSVLAAQEPRLVAGVVGGLAERAPAAHAVWVREPPVVGAALLALEAAGATPNALERAAREVVDAIAARVPS
jgi:N-acetylglucosamine kinase-like BadF-type ATPase